MREDAHLIADHEAPYEQLTANSLEKAKETDE